MEAYHISGGRPLRGSIAIHGAKNGVLPILAATLAVGGVGPRLVHGPAKTRRLRLFGVAHIGDPQVAAELLHPPGAAVVGQDHHPDPCRL